MLNTVKSLIKQGKGPFFMPLGGAGEIGANFYLYGSEGYWIAVDCGQGFINNPSGDPQVLIPDLQAAKDNGIKIQAILITHGHEDHIGALPHLWKKLKCPVYSAPFALELIASRIKDKRLLSQLHTIEPLKSYEFGPFKVEWIPVTHSIPEANGLFIQVNGRNLYHTGDWKLDPAPVLGKTTAINRLQAIGKQGIDIIIGDSTNAPLAGHSASETCVQKGLLEMIRPLPNRVLVTCFASNLARIYSLGKIAQLTKRQVTLLGRSMQRIHGIGKKLNYLNDFPELVPAQELGYLPRHEQLIICTGSQGEPKAALARLAEGKHQFLELEAGDQVIFSSKTIPGNEEAVERLTEQLAARNIQLLTDEDGLIHASGHPAQDEIRQLYEWLRPKHLLAMHGEDYHQDAHCEFAKSLDVNSRSAKDGEIYDLSAAPRLMDAIDIPLIQLENR